MSKFNPNDELLPVLIEEIQCHRDAPDQWQTPDWTTPPAPAVNMVLEKDGRCYSLFTMLAHFGSAQHVTLEELTVESFYPADEDTRAALIELSANRVV